MSFHVVKGVGDYEMYDEPKYVNEAVDTLDVFSRSTSPANSLDSGDLG